jgi:mono/diheme cytochrome c family protein
MNQYKLISLLALLLLVIILPIYTMLEPRRMAQAQEDLRQEFVSDAAVMYVENCALCHGAAGEGIGPTPGLDNEGLRTADYDFLFKTIARGRYDTTMSAWHSDEGGIFNDYQVDELVALIRYVDWSQVRELAAEQGLIPPTLPVPEVDEAFLEEITALGPDGNIWAEGMSLYATNCTVCHGIHGEGSDLGLPLNTTELRARDTAELARIVSEGVPGTAMAGWKNTLSVEEIDKLVAFLHNWDVIEAQGLELEAPQPVQIDLNNPEEVLALGETIYNATCSSCHGENGSGGSGPALNSLQVLTRKTDEQIENTIINGSQRPNSIMPVFGDRFTAVEIAALVDYIRAWEPTATWVENPRGTAQGGGPPWLRATPDAQNPVSPGQGQGRGQGQGKGQGQGGGPPWRQNTDGTGTAADQAAPVEQSPTTVGATIYVQGDVVTAEGNMLSVITAESAIVEAMLGPPWYWTENGIPLAPGDQVEFEGFESPEHMEINWLTNLTTGQTIQLRTAEGMPVWSSGETTAP